VTDDVESAPPRFRAVLFDWRGTLVQDPEHAWWVTRALQSLGRPVDDAEVADIVVRLHAAQRQPEHAEADERIDTSAAFHRQASLRLFADAGVDPELADALYAVDFDPDSHPLYPDTADVLTTLHRRGVKIAVVSDIHFDLRGEFADRGLIDLIDAFVLSFEHGVQKPDRRMFDLALDNLGVQARECLMVGDRATHDGGAAAAGITTLVLPFPGHRPEVRLADVLVLVG
jgi:HAD superfamily hydrolase (TIGR01509 family)